MTTNLEDWTPHATEALDVADAVLWTRIQNGTWNNAAEARKVMAAHRHIEQAKEALMDAEAMAKSVMPMTPDPEKKRTTPEMRPHAHAWKMQLDGREVCEVPGCGLVRDDNVPPI